MYYTRLGQNMWFSDVSLEKIDRMLHIPETGSISIIVEFLKLVIQENLPRQVNVGFIQ